MSKKKDQKKHARKSKAKAKEQKQPKRTPVFVARVLVSLKPTVNDPEGITIGGALASLGFEGITGVRSGRYFQLTLSAPDSKTARSQVDQMCSRLLANPVIETYSFELAQA